MQQERDSSPSSISSEFQFLSYKVDSLNFSLPKTTGVLVFKEPLTDSNTSLALSITQPSVLLAKNQYIGGIAGKVEIRFEGCEPAILELHVSGLFEATQRLEKSIVENLVKIQIPSLLLPYLRSAITSILVTAGFQPIIFPLVNMHALAELELKDVEIRVIE